MPGAASRGPGSGLTGYATPTATGWRVAVRGRRVRPAGLRRPHTSSCCLGPRLVPGALPRGGSKRSCCCCGHSNPHSRATFPNIASSWTTASSCSKSQARIPRTPAFRQCRTGQELPRMVPPETSRLRRWGWRGMLGACGARDKVLVSVNGLLNLAALPPANQRASQGHTTLRLKLR